MVIQAETADAEISRMRRYVADRGLHGLQLIELHGPRGMEKNAYFRAHHRSLKPIEAALRKEAILVTRRQMHARPTYTVRESGRDVPVEIVEPYRNARFCAHCTRLRVTSDGELKPCLMRADNHVNVLDAMRRGASDEEIEDLILEANYRREPYWLAGESGGAEA
jgi:cyclic pyranopterin phosphate synthase